MSRLPRQPGAPADYAIGYGRPPIATRFQPGKSGNPRGRPRGRKTMAKLLEEALMRQVTVPGEGRDRKMRMQDVIILGLVNDAARRDHRALKLLFALMDRYGDGPEHDIDLAELAQEDQAIIASYLRAQLAQGQDAAGQRDNEDQPDSDDEVAR
jgi:hypothetical protein